MLPLLLFLAVTAPHPCDAGIVQTSRPLTIEEQPAVCVQYATAAVGDSSVVVYAIEAVDHPKSSDFPHQVFVAFGKRRADNVWKLSDQHEVTATLLSLSRDDIGYFILTDARVNRFTLEGARFVDVGVWTTISGSGGISATKDLMFRIEGGTLRLAATLETEGYARGGVTFLHQITSELLVGKDELVQVKRDRLARGRNPEKPLTVHCKVSRTVYKLIDGRLERSNEIDASEFERLRPRLRPVPRFDTREIVPCCAGCSIAN
jgi:hypothetical protein